MDGAERVLIVGAMLNLLWGYVTGFFFAAARERSAFAPRYLVMVHVGSFLQAGMLFGLVFAVRLSKLPASAELGAALALVASSLLIAAKDTIDWLQGVEDEFRERPVLPRLLANLGVAAALPGFGILFAGVVSALL